MRAAGSSSPIRIEPVIAATADARTLIGELEQVLAAEYPPEQRHGLTVEAVFQPHIRFFLARLDGVASGCAGVALFPEFAEVKRMYVRQQARGKGLAQAMLVRLESEVRAAGLRLLRLETGDRQIVAIRCYTGAGFRRCPPFGDYVGMPPAAIATSVFFEKSLTPFTG